MIDPSLLTANDFIGVRAALVSELGNDAASALVLTRIFYRADERWREAVEVEGTWWWRASYDVIAEETGLTRQQVRRTVTALVGGGHIETAKHHLQGINDQTLSYRVCLSDPAADVLDQTHRDVVDRPLLPITKTVEDVDISASVQLERDFTRFYALWPRRVGKAAALRAFKSALRRATADTILDGARRYRAWAQESGQDTRFVPYPATWLNRDGWEDELVELTPAPTLPATGPRRLTAAEQNLAEFQNMHGLTPEAQAAMQRALAEGDRRPGDGSNDYEYVPCWCEPGKRHPECPIHSERQ
jgi:hypothetical protein